MIVTKRDGTEQVFDINKIKNAITLAYLREAGEIKKDEIGKIVKNIELELNGYENVEVEFIQDIVCESILNINHIVAEGYKNYRDKHNSTRRRVLSKNIKSKLQFINDYQNATNASTGSKYDANANVTCKNITTMSGEVNKYENIQINRASMYNKLSELYDFELADEYIEWLESHRMYTHDETSLASYCCAITMYPFLLDGLKGLGGETAPPNNLHSYCGGFINLVFAVASQFSGAVATAEYLMYMAYFCEKEWGEDFYKREDELVILGNRPRTIKGKIEDYFGQVAHSINVPSAARNYQSVFWNISYFDEFYFKSIFDHFVYPDGTEPKWEQVDYIQRLHMRWFNKERESHLLTFPVETVALLNDGSDMEDKAYNDLVAQELSEGHSFFIYTSGAVDSLSSCCRLRNELSDNEFSYSLGAGGVSTGSINVMTLNINRLIQDKMDIREAVKKIHKFQIAYRAIIEEFITNNMIPAYSAGFIDIKKQFLTIGVNGVVEGAESLGIPVKDCDEYNEYITSILKPIYEENKKIKKETGIMFNTEFVPAENLGVKNANWDKNDGYIVPRDCYNSYFYVVEDNDINIIDHFILHGNKYTQYLDGGSALHQNLKEHLSKEQYSLLLKNAVKLGVPYFTFNIMGTACNECGYISKDTLGSCPKCGSENIDHTTRIIGYLKRISNFSESRQVEASKRAYH